MKQAVLSNWNLPWIPLSAFIMFIVCFALYTYWTYRKENKKVYEEASLIPLEDPMKAGSFVKGQSYES